MMAFMEENSLRIALIGATGRMGRVLVKLIHAHDRCCVHGGLVSAGSAHLGEDLGILCGLGEIGAKAVCEAEKLIVDAHAIIDFSTPAASVFASELAAQARIPHIIGVTGFSTEQDRALLSASRHAPIVKSGNMSVGIHLLCSFVRRAARRLGEDFDVEICEMHHRDKKDAPSGTALLLGESVAAGLGIDFLENKIYGRDGLRNLGEIGFSSLRGGSVVGDHRVIFAGSGEQLILSHRAEDRSIFARGALRAALWAYGRAPGMYSMGDVLGVDRDGD